MQTIPSWLHETNNALALFTGYEKEGPRVGLFTLFVKGRVPLSIIKEYLGDCNHVYFNAGRQSGYELESVVSVLESRLVTLEIPYSDVEAVCCIETPHLLLLVTDYPEDYMPTDSRIHRKVEVGDKVIIVNTRNETFVNTFDGYPQDTVVYSPL